jgi:hypothetical protein
MEVAMRSTLPCLALSVAIVSGCHCGQKLSSLSSDLAIIQPTAKSGDMWLADFGNVAEGGTYTAPITVANNGQLTGNVLSAVLRHGSDPAFSLSAAPTPVAIQGGGSVTFTVTYVPRQAGSAMGFVDLQTDDPKLAQATVKLTAVGQAAQVQVCMEAPTAPNGWQCNAADGSGLAIDFGFIQVSSGAVSTKVQVRNQGTAPLSYFGSGLAAGSSTELSITPAQTEPATGAPIAPGANVQYDIAYTPTTPGNIAGTAIINTSDSALPSISIPIRGGAAVSADCHIDAAPTSVNFGSVPNNTTADQTVVVVNDGLKPCTVNSVMLAGSTSFSDPGAPAAAVALAPNTVLTVTVHYAPVGTTTDNGTLTIASTDPVQPSLVVTITGASVAPPACQLTAVPPLLDFGGEPPGTRTILSATLSAAGSGICTVTTAKIRSGDPNFILAPPPTLIGTYPIIIPVIPSNPLGNVFGAPALGVSYVPAAASTDNDVLDISYLVGFTGPTYTVSVPLKGRAGDKQLCIVPSRLHFGVVPVGQSKDLPFTMTACGSTAVHVTAITVEPAGTPFSLQPAPALPLSLTVGGSSSQPVHLVPTSSAASNAQVHVVSDDPVFSDQYVDVDTGPEIVPPDAGEVLYSWTAGAFSAGGPMSGTIFKTYLQGAPNRTAFYGTDNGNSCAGCHAVSPDGRYVALVEYGTSPTMRILDAKTGGSIPIPGTASGLFPAWRPNVNSNPPYQFVYSDGNVLKIASVAGSILGQVAGANDPSMVQTQPSWGPNGQIAFVKGTPSSDAGVFEIVGPADLMLVPEGGGTAVPVVGASGNGGDNYYPEFSPNGKYIAYTFSASGQTTRSATDSVIKLVTADNTGQIVNLPQLNAAGPNSWPTWAKDGTFLSFSSTRSGGKGSADVYFAPVDQTTGADGPATNLGAVNTFNFDHIARWAFLPP